jgi:hypothetical protein
VLQLRHKQVPRHRTEGGAFAIEDSGEIFYHAPMLRAIGDRVLLAMALGVISSGLRASAAPTFGSALTNGEVNIAGLTEVSGVAASRNNANVLWTHNDSGHPAVIYAIDTFGRLLGKYNVPGNVDNEDIAIGPGPLTNVSYIYVGDIGDNTATRANIKIYQIPEPAVYGRQYTNPPTVTPKGARTITLTYPDGARDAEALMVDSVTGDLFIFTKESPTRMYTASKSLLDTTSSIALTFMQAVNIGFPNGADISPSGNEIVVRNENFARLWLRANGQDVPTALTGTAIPIPVTGTPNGEVNGEAIGFDAVGRGYFTLSDSSVTQPLRYFPRTSDDGPPTQRELVSAGASWQYLDKGTDQGTDWRMPAFDSSSWSNGVAQLGYGDGDEQTVVNFGPNTANRYITTYFRKQFNVENAGSITGLTLKLLVDDGAAVFLNGAPVVYFGLVTNATYLTLATAQSDNLEDTWFSFAIESSMVTNGVNTLAVEVHQSSPSSSDLSFDLQLIATYDAAAIIPPKLNVTRVGSSEKLSWPAAAAGYVLEETDRLGTGSVWISTVKPKQIVSDEFFVTNGFSESAKFYRLRKGQ